MFSLITFDNSKFIFNRKLGGPYEPQPQAQPVKSCQYGELPHFGKNLDRIRCITELQVLINSNLTLNTI